MVLIKNKKCKWFPSLWIQKIPIKVMAQRCWFNKGCQSCKNNKREKSVAVTWKYAHAIKTNKYLQIMLAPTFSSSHFYPFLLLFYLLLIFPSSITRFNSPYFFFFLFFQPPFCLGAAGISPIDRPVSFARSLKDFHWFSSNYFYNCLFLDELVPFHLISVSFVCEIGLLPIIL